jgi:hypothetical protein
MKNLPHFAQVVSASLVLAVAGAGLTGCIVSTGCSMNWQPANFKGPVNAAATLTAPSAVDAKTENGAVTLIAGTGTELTVTGTARATSAERLALIKVVVEQGADGVAMVSVVWPPDGRKGSEGCDLTITVPTVAKVAAKSSNGAITSTGLSGDLVLKTSNGAVTVNGHTGPLNVDTSNGAIKASDVNGPVMADTSNGAISISLTSAEAPVQAKSSNGSITLVVPDAYSGAVSCSTSNGSVTNGTKGALAAGSTKTKGTITLGAGAAASTLRTSNGSVTVKQGQ